MSGLLSLTLCVVAYSDERKVDNKEVKKVDDKKDPKIDDKKDPKSPDFSKLIVGKWEATKVDQGTIPEGSVLNFTADGKLSGTIPDQDEGIKGTFKITQDSLTAIVVRNDMERERTLKITKLDDKEMVLTDPDGKKVTFTRKK
jgi:uncharacterized protein (TIGR03066 family)